MSDENNAGEQTAPAEENTQVENQVQENNAASEPTEGTEGETSEHVEGEPEKKPKTTGWQIKRINELTARNAKAAEELENSKRQTEALITELAAARSGAGAGEDKARLPHSEIDRLANERAGEIASKKISEAQYASSLDSIWNSGVKEFPDFASSVENLQGSFGEKFGAALPIFTKALDNPHTVMHHLGENLDEAARILSLDPVKQVAELTKLEARLATKQKPISKVAAPIKTIDGKGKVERSLDNKDLSMAEWNELRTKDLIKRGKRLF